MLAARVHLATPLVILFVVGATISATTAMQQALLIDLYPQSPATVSAAINVCRCLLCAGGTSVVQYMIDAMGVVKLLERALWKVLLIGQAYRLGCEHSANEAVRQLSSSGVCSLNIVCCFCSNK